MKACFALVVLSMPLCVGRPACAVGNYVSTQLSLYNTATAAQVHRETAPEGGGELPGETPPDERDANSEWANATSTEIFEWEPDGPLEDNPPYDAVLWHTVAVQPDLQASGTGTASWASAGVLYGVGNTEFGYFDSDQPPAGANQPRQHYTSQLPEEDEEYLVYNGQSTTWSPEGEDTDNDNVDDFFTITVAAGLAAQSYVHVYAYSPDSASATSGANSVETVGLNLY